MKSVIPSLKINNNTRTTTLSKQRNYLFNIIFWLQTEAADNTKFRAAFICWSVFYSELTPYSPYSTLYTHMYDMYD